MIDISARVSPVCDVISLGAESVMMHAQMRVESDDWWVGGGVKASSSSSGVFSVYEVQGESLKGRSQFCSWWLRHISQYSVTFVKIFTQTVVCTAVLCVSHRESRFAHVWCMSPEPTHNSLIQFLSGCEVKTLNIYTQFYWCLCWNEKRIHVILKMILS